jgi:Mg2+/Co2+ transporter CorB
VTTSLVEVVMGQGHQWRLREALVLQQLLMVVVAAAVIATVVVVAVAPQLVGVVMATALMAMVVVAVAVLTLQPLLTLAAAGGGRVTGANPCPTLLEMLQQQQGANMTAVGQVLRCRGRSRRVTVLHSRSHACQRQAHRQALRQGPRGSRGRRRW